MGIQNQTSSALFLLISDTIHLSDTDVINQKRKVFRTGLPVSASAAAAATAATATIATLSSDIDA